MNKSRSVLLLVVTLLFRTSVPMATLTIVLLAATAALPVGVVVLTGRLVAAVESLASAHTQPDITGAVLPALVWLTVVYATQQAVGEVSYALTRSLGSRVALLLRETIMSATLRPAGIAHLEDPRTSRLIALATGMEGRAFAPAEMVGGLFAMVSSRLRGFAVALLLWSYHPWAPFALLAAWSLIPFWIRRQTRTQMERTESVTPELREADYVKDLLTRPDAAKEIRVFGLERWLQDRYARWRLRGLEVIWRARRSRRWNYIPYLLLPTAVSGLVLADLAAWVGRGAMGLPQFTVFALAVVGAKEWGRTMAWWTRSLYGSGSVAHAIELGRHTGGPVSCLVGRGDARGMPARSIVLREVAFRYPGASAPVFRGLNLTIPVGRSLAIVGRNGAGKTTLAKLLARLYDPETGCILVDDVDLRTIDPASWRARVAVIFQDFVRYELGVRENVGFGCTRLLHDDEALRAAATGAGAQDLVSRVGWDTTLSRTYTGGVELSGGQWQRVALARALAAVQGGASLLILDEPTANLDVRAEAALFRRFLDLTRGLTTILISHRMSSVRHADQICVVDGGVVVERGPHEALMEAGGIYAEMFRIQGRRFREAADGA